MTPKEIDALHTIERQPNNWLPVAVADTLRGLQQRGFIKCLSDENVCDGAELTAAGRKMLGD